MNFNITWPNSSFKVKPNATCLFSEFQRKDEHQMDYWNDNACMNDDKGQWSNEMVMMQ